MMPAGLSTSRCYLGDLLSGFETVGAYPARLPIIGVSNDSRTCRPGELFLAVGRGVAKAAEAVGAGACAVLVETGEQARLRFLDVPVVAVKELRHQQGRIAARFYGEPSAQLRVIGITGTNGKTSCSHFLAAALPDCALIGTLGYGTPGALVSSGYTTPDAVELQRILSVLLHSGYKTVVIEVSSHALEQGRVDGTRVQAALFTNLGRDHLDYHGDEAAYGAAKAKLFRFPNLRYAAINGDDSFGRQLLANLPATVQGFSYGLETGDVHAAGVVLTPSGLALTISAQGAEARLQVPLFGAFNVENLLAVAALLLQMGYSLEQAAHLLAKARPVPGRMQLLGAPGKPAVVVDYAHNPGGLAAALRALRGHFGAAAITCVFGCGGDRDRGKRPLMGGIAEQLAERVILTDDNPRNEPAEQISDEILAGMREPGAVTVIHDRRAAIRQALEQAGAEDLVLIAGKGAETAQVIGAETIPFDDADVVRSLLGISS